MPSQRKRIGYLPSEEVHEIIDKLCRANEFSQSKVTGLLVEEALRSRGVLSDNFSLIDGSESKYINYSFEQQQSSQNNISSDLRDFYTVDKKTLSNDIKLMHEFIKFKYFKKIMKQNSDIISG